MLFAVPSFLWPVNCNIINMASVYGADITQQHYACADMVRIVCESTSELAILLEIWESGGVVQTSFPIAAGSAIAIAIEKTEVAAQVTKCEADHDFGYIIDINVASPKQWFPRGYIPAWHSPEVETAVNSGSLVC